MRPPPIRLVVLVGSLRDSRREATQLPQSIDRSCFVPELWALSRGGELPFAAGNELPVIYLSRRNHGGLIAAARMAARLWHHRPDVLYTLPGAANLWGPLIARILRIPVVSAFPNSAVRPCLGILKRCASRIVVNSAHVASLTNQQVGIDPNEVTAVSTAQQIEQVLREVAQLGKRWTTTANGDAPPELPLWPVTASSTPPEEIIERGRFRPDRSLRGVTVPTLTVYLPDAGCTTGTAAIICPGGGYAALSIDKEGHDVARKLTTLGVAGLVLKYRLPRPDVAGLDTPWPLQDIMRALSMARTHASEWKIDPRRLGVIGFSAGGHMAAAASSADRQLAFAALIYPVITMEPRLTHKLSRLQLLGRRPSPKIAACYSYETQVTPQTCPTFLVHAGDDDVVKVDNSLLYVDALRRAGVAYEFLCLETGGHGFGLGIQGGAPATWPERLSAWLAGLGLR